MPIPPSIAASHRAIDPLVDRLSDLTDYEIEIVEQATAPVAAEAIAAEE